MKARKSKDEEMINEFRTHIHTHTLSLTPVRMSESRVTGVQGEGGRRSLNDSWELRKTASKQSWEGRKGVRASGFVLTP